MWRKVNPSTLFVGMWIGAATIENSVEVPQKLKLELPYDAAFPLLGIYPKKMKTLIWNDICTPVFTAAFYNCQDMEAT